MFTARQFGGLCFRTLVLLPLTAISTFGAGGQSSVLTAIDSKAIGRWASGAELTKNHAVSVSRNTLGTAVYVEMPSETNGVSTVLIISVGRVEKVQVPGRSLVFNDANKVICWMTNRTLVFDSGHQIEISIYQRFGFSPGGRFFFFSDPTNGAAVFQTAQPNHPLVQLPDGFLPQSLFFQTNHLFVFGRKLNPTGSEVAWGLVYSETNDFSGTPHEIDVSHAGGVVDVSMDGCHLLVRSKRDLWPSWFLFNTKSGSRMRVGLAKQDGLFLSEELHGWIKNGRNKDTSFTSKKLEFPIKVKPPTAR